MKKITILLLLLFLTSILSFAQEAITEYETHGFNTVEIYSVGGKKICMFYNTETGSLRTYDVTRGGITSMSDSLYSTNIYADWVNFLFVYSDTTDKTFLFRYKKDGNIKTQEVFADGTLGDVISSEKWDTGYTDMAYNPETMFIYMTNPAKGYTKWVDVGNLLF